MCDATIDDPAAEEPRRRPRDLRVVAPDFPTRRRVERMDDTPGRREIEHPVDHDRRRLDPAIRAEIEAPGEPQLRDVQGIDLIEGAMTLLPGVASMRGPTGVDRRSLVESTEDPFGPAAIAGARSGAAASPSRASPG